MKKNILAAILALVSAGCLAVGLTACRDRNVETGDKWGSVYSIEAAYAEASTLGYSGTLEEFIASISGKDGVNGTNGKDGVGISKIEIISDNLKVTLTDGSVLELGSIKGDKGDTGAQGDKGDTGAQGESAYEIWLKNGHTGTEEDFLEWLKADGTNDNPQELDFYLLDDNTYAVSIAKAFYLSNVVVPSTHNGKSVSTVLGDAIVGLGGLLYSNIKSVVISEGIKTIGEGALYGCSSLESVTIPKGVTTIGDSAFSNCSSLVSINIPDGVTEIGSSAFSWCSSLESITIPDSVTEIGSGAFSNCTSLTSVYYKGTAEEWKGINIYSDGNTQLTTATIYYYSETEPTTAGNFWHYDTDGKTIVAWQSIEEEGEEIEYVAGTPGLEYTLSGDFYRCTGIGTATETDITIANYYNDKRVTMVYPRAFQDCTSLTSVTIPDGILAVHTMAFSGCTSLERVSLGNTVKTVAKDAFKNCTLLAYNEYDNATYLGNSSNPYQVLIRAKDINITSCQINSNTKAIASNAFSSCNSLTEIEIPDKVISLGTYAFAYCSSLESVKISEGITYISSYTFKDCTSLVNVNIPNSLQTLSNNVFEGCTSLKLSEYDNAMYLGNDTNAYIALIKAKATTIASCQINANTKFICDYAFENCTLLTQIEIPVGVVGIETHAFSGCSSLKSIAFPEGFKMLDIYAFENCTSLESVIICESVTDIRDGVFSNCTSLERVYYKGTPVEWMGVNIYSDNIELTNATIYYYSETQPTEEGNFWHYDTDGETVVVW